MRKPSLKIPRFSAVIFQVSMTFPSYSVESCEFVVPNESGDVSRDTSPDSFGTTNSHDSTEYEGKVIDTWKMTAENRGIFKDGFRIEFPEKPYMAVQVKKV